MGVIDQRLEALAASQYGVFAVWQLDGIGVDRRAVLPRVRDERLRRLYRGVYSTAPYLPIRGRMMAAVLACGPRAVLSHRPAGLVLDVTDRKGGPIDVTVPQGTRNRRAYAPIKLSSSPETTPPSTASRSPPLPAPSWTWPRS